MTIDEAVRRAPDRMQQALTAAHLYYMQDLTMEAIAHELHVSRSSVSRLLTHARATGLVDIQIHSPADKLSALERALRERYGVVFHLVPVPDQISDVDRLERVAMSAARLLPRFLDSNVTIGIAWGSTMTAVSRHLVPMELRNVEVVQLNGAGNTRTTGIVYASEILRRFGKAYGAHVQQFPIPALFDHASTKAALWRERSTWRVLEVQSRVDVAVFGLGSPLAAVPSHVYIGGYLEPADYAELEEQHVVGDIATRFYRIDGSDDGIPLNLRSTGPDLAAIRRYGRRIGVVSGEAKLASLRGALAASLMTDVVLDDGLGRDLLAVQ